MISKFSYYVGIVDTVSTQGVYLLEQNSQAYHLRRQIRGICLKRKKGKEKREKRKKKTEKTLHDDDMMI
jgi:hypothetical protein